MDKDIIIKLFEKKEYKAIKSIFDTKEEDYAIYNVVGRTYNLYAFTVCDFCRYLHTYEE